METKSMKCPQCGATMEFDTERSIFSCAYCGYSEIVETANEKAERLGKLEYARIFAREKAMREAADVDKKNNTKKKTKSILRTIIIILLVIAAGFVIIKIADSLKEEYNPFENLKVTFSGLDGSGTCEILTDPDHRRQVDYYFPQENLFEGETITIKASSDTYRLTEKSHAYTVSGLDLRLTSEEQITEAVKDYITELSKSELISNGDYNSKIHNTPRMIFLVVGKESTTLIDTYISTFSRDSYSRDYITAVEYDDVYTSKGISPIIFTHQLSFGNVESIVLDESIDTGLVSAMEPSYCGAYCCFKSEADLYTEIKKSFPNANQIICINK